MMLNTRPIGLVFKQHPRDPANVNEKKKNMCDPHICATYFIKMSVCKISRYFLWVASKLIFEMVVITFSLKIDQT